jgi:capping protein beta
MTLLFGDLIDAFGENQTNTTDKVSKVALKFVWLGIGTFARGWKKMEAALGLLRRMPPKQSETALSALLSLIPQHSSDLLSQVDLPLQVLRDIESGKDFILCEYNRDADSYRSPWSNKYLPPLEDALYPSSELRKLEVEANDIFAIYRDQ